MRIFILNLVAVDSVDMVKDSRQVVIVSVDIVTGRRQVVIDS